MPDCVLQPAPVSTNSLAWPSMNSRSALPVIGLFDAELMLAAESAPREHVESQAHALRVGVIPVRRMHDGRREQANVVDLRLVAPALAVVDVELVDVEVERGRKRNQAIDVAMKHEIAARFVDVEIQHARDQRVAVDVLAGRLAA